MRVKGVVGIFVVTALILLVPIAMHFTDEVNWGLLDFIIAGALLSGAGLLIQLTIICTHNRQVRFIVGAVVAMAVLTIWAHLAVGIV